MVYWGSGAGYWEIAGERDGEQGKGGGNILQRGSIMLAAVIVGGDEDVGCVAGDGAQIEDGVAGDPGLGGEGVARLEGPAFEHGVVVVGCQGGDVEGAGE